MLTHATQTRSHVLVALIVLATTAVVAPPAQAQESFAGSMEVTLVNVELWATDAQGRHLSGLSADDFEVFEDGDLVAITHFSEVNEGRIIVRDRRAQADGGGQGDTPGEQATATLVLYFDLLHLNTATIGGLVEELKKSLATSSVRPERVVVIAQTQTTRVVAPLGSSRQELVRALDEISSSNLAVGLSQIERHQEFAELARQWELAKSVSESGGGGRGLTSTGGRLIFGASMDASDACQTFVQRAMPSIEAVAFRRQAIIEQSIDNLRQTVSFLGGIDGVKTLLWVGDGLELVPGSELMAYVKKLCPSTNQMSSGALRPDEVASRMLELTSHASANRVTIYAIQSVGLRVDAGMSAANDSFDIAEGQSSIGMAVRAAEVSGMRVLAAQTGGRAIFNTHAFGEELHKIDEEMSGYYSLAFTPLHGGDGRQHVIKVKAKNRDIKVRYRQRYLDKSEGDRIAERLTTTLTLGIVENPHQVRLGAGDLKGSDDDWQLSLHVLVPADRLTFLPQAEGSAAQVTLFFGSADEQNRLSDVFQKRYRVRQPAEGQEAMLDFVVDLQLAGGAQVLGVAVVDEATREASYVATTVHIGAAEES